MGVILPTSSGCEAPDITTRTMDASHAIFLATSGGIIPGRPDPRRFEQHAGRRAQEGRLGVQTLDLRVAGPE